MTENNLRVKRSQLQIGDLVFIDSHNGWFKITSEAERTTGYTGYGESWKVYVAKATNSAKPEKDVDILQGFSGHFGDEEFEVKRKPVPNK